MQRKSAAGVGSMVKRFLVGSGDIAADGRKLVTDAYGVYDDTLADGKRLQRIMKRSDGLSPEQLDATKGVLFDGVNKGNYDNINNVQDALRQTKSPDELAARLKELTSADYTPDQAAAIQKEWGSRKSWGETMAPILIGEEPLKVWQERFQRGGLVGKGGLLTAELAPSQALRNGVKSIGTNLQAGNYSGAGRAAVATAVPAAGYGLGLGFNYAMPAYATAQDVKQQREQGQSGVRALGAGVTSAVGNLALNPLGLAPSIASGTLVDNASSRIRGGPAAGGAAASPSPTTYDYSEYDGGFQQEAFNGDAYQDYGGYQQPSYPMGGGYQQPSYPMGGGYQQPSYPDYGGYPPAYPMGPYSNGQY